MNYIQVLEDLISKVKELDIKELKTDLEYLENSGYNTSYLAVQQSVERVVYYLRKYKNENLAKQIEDTIGMLQDKITTADKCDTFTYSAKDILVARDIAFLNNCIKDSKEYSLAN